MVKRRKITALAAVLALTLFIGTVGTVAAARAETDVSADDAVTDKLTALIKSVYDADGGTASTDRYDFDLLVGNFGAVENAQAFDEKMTDSTGMQLDANNQFMAYVYNGDINAAKLGTANDSTVGHNAVFIRLTAKKDIAVEMTHPAFGVAKDSWVTQNTAFKTYYRAKDAYRPREIKSAELKALQVDNDGTVTTDSHGTVLDEPYNAYIPADSLTRSANLKAGSQLYLAYAYTGSDQSYRDIGLILDITTSETAYVGEEPVMNRESKYGYSSMVSTTIANALYNGKMLVVPETGSYPAGYEGSADNATETELNTWQLMYGKLDGDVSPFTYFTNVGAGAASDAVMYPSGSNSTTYLAGFQRWQLRCSDGLDAIIRITAKTDSLLKITHKEFATTWAMHSGIRIVAEDADGVRVTVKNTMLLSTTDSKTGEYDNYYVCDVQMKAGDTVYVVYYTNTISSATCGFMPSFEASADEYDEDARPDFAAAKAVMTARPAAVSELGAYMFGLTELRYSLESWMEIQNIYDDFTDAVNEYDTLDALNAGLAEYKALMDAVSTLVDDNDSLWDYKSEKIDELAAYVNALNPKKYSKDNWNKVRDAFAAGEEAIQAASSKVAVNNALTTAKKAVDEIESDKGCGGLAAGSSAIGAIALLLTGLVLLKKRKGEKGNV